MTGSTPVTGMVMLSACTCVLSKYLWVQTLRVCVVSWLKALAASLLLLSCVTLDETATSLCLYVLTCKMGIWRTGKHSHASESSRGQRPVLRRKPPLCTRLRADGRPIHLAGPSCKDSSTVPPAPHLATVRKLPIRADRHAGGKSSKGSTHNTCLCAGRSRGSWRAITAGNAPAWGTELLLLPHQAVLVALPSLPLSVWVLCSDPQALLTLRGSDKKAESSLRIKRC